MNRFKYEAYLQEFPFLREILTRERDYAYLYLPHSEEKMQELLSEGWQVVKREPAYGEGEYVGIALFETVPPHRIDFIRVRRADENLLTFCPSEYYWDGSLVEQERWQKVHFVLQDGTIIFDAVLKDGHSGSNYSGVEEKRWEGESILEALSKLDDPDSVAYIAIENYDYSWSRGDEERREYHIEIYKPPKGVKYSDLIEKAREKARAEVKTEADF